MIDPDLDLSIETLTRACKGDVSKLPSFAVHNDAAWPWHNKVRVDNLNRIHIRRATFNRIVAGKLPVRAGLWLRADVQHFTLDLQPHHLQGSEDTKADAKRTARVMAKADEQGRLPDEHNYKEEALSKSQLGPVSRDDLAEVATRDEKGSVGSTALLGSGDTD